MLKYVVTALLIAFVWFLVAFFELNSWIGIIATLVILIALGVMLLVRRMRAVRAARNIEKALGAQAEEQIKGVRPELQGEMRAIQAEFDKAVASLKTSKMGKGGAQALYALPWYMIIGPPGTGKSTALRQSGLQFPYLSASGGGVRGVGGTRNCEWWLTNDAVLLDTAGRYTSDDDDRDEWFGFLDLLKQFRPRKPVNGVLVAVGVNDLGGAREEDVSRLAKRIRERIDEVMQRLHMIVPVYLLFTKCDLVPGFVEMFNDLGKEKRQQIWGFTVPLGQRNSQPGELFRERFDELAKITFGRSMRRLKMERRTETREKIYEFPQQFEVLRDNLADFVGTLFAENVYQGTPVMRGVYFTSGTQEGRPIDRVMQSMAAAFGVQPRALTTAQSVESKSYFLHDVFARVVFPDQNVAAQSPEEIRAERRRRLLISAVSLLVAGAIGGISWLTYSRNRELVRSSQQVVDTVAQARERQTVQQSTGQGGALPSLMALETLRGRLTELYEAHNSGPPFLSRFGMYQGDKLFEPIRRLYTRMMREQIVTPIVERDVAAMNQLINEVNSTEAALTPDQRSRLYDQLRLHLLLTTPHEEGEPGLDSTLQTWLAGQLVQRWAQLPGASTEPGADVMTLSNARFYTQLLAGDSRLALARNTAAVDGARTALTRVAAADRALAQLIADIDRDNYGLTLTSMVGAGVTVLHTTHTVRGAFTRRGWEERVRSGLPNVLNSVSGEPWVIGRAQTTAPGARTEDQLVQLRSSYFEQYIAEWQGFIDSIEVGNPTTPAQAQAMLEEFVNGAPKPLERLFRAVSYNAHLEEPQNTQSAAVTSLMGSAQRGALASVARRGPVGQALTTAANAAQAQRAGQRAPERPPTLREQVEQHFAGFFGFGMRPPPAPSAPGAPPQDRNPAVISYQEQLEFMRDQINRQLALPTNMTPMNRQSRDQEFLNRLTIARQTSLTLIRGATLQNQQPQWCPRLAQILCPPVDYATRFLPATVATAAAEPWCLSACVGGPAPASPSAPAPAPAPAPAH